MNTKTLVSTKTVEFYYAQRMVQPGELFEAEEKDAHVLELARVARVATPEEAQGESSGKREYERSDMTAAEAEEKPRRKRGYPRRDMVAEKP
jgi:hypothetical protein